MDTTARTPRTPLPPRGHRRLVAASVTALVALLLAGCSGGAEESMSADREVAGGASAPEPASESAPGPASEADVAASSGVTGSALGRTARTASAVRQRAVISTGTVSLEARDVEAVLFDVQRVVAETGAEVSDEQTGTDRAGEVRRSQLVLRVPAARFGEAMTALARLDSARLRSAQRVSEDVTTQVIDTAARIRAQQASLERVELLLTRAERLRDVVAIEAQLTRRQAELDSLEQQQAWLSDQTSLATITVLVERPEEPRKAEVEEAGFVAGLGAGWDALGSSTVAVLTAVGAVLPFVGLLALLGVPAWLLLRRAGPGRVEEGQSG